MSCSSRMATATILAMPSKSRHAQPDEELEGRRCPAHHAWPRRPSWRCSQNPATPSRMKNLKAVDVLLITHGHGDHLGDAVELAQKHKPKVVGIYELCAWLQKKGVENTAPMNKGGSQMVGDVRVTDRKSTRLNS